MERVILVRGSGDIATGTAHKLIRCGYKVIMTEIEKPTFIRRAVCFGEAVYDGTAEVEGIKAVRIRDLKTSSEIMMQGMIPIIIDESLSILKEMSPYVLVDAIIAKKNIGTFKGMAQLVIGLGPGFNAGGDVDLIIETNRGHNLGRIIEQGYAETDTGIPGNIGGLTSERIIKAPAEGIISHYKDIGSMVKKGEIIGTCGNMPIESPAGGIIRGFIREGLNVPKGLKIGDVDPRGIKEYCYTISNKARTIAGGVLEAVLRFEKCGR